MTEDLVIIGTGGHAREILDVVEAINAAGRRFTVLGFLDEARDRHGISVRGYEVLGGLPWLEHRGSQVLFVIGVGNPAVRRRVALRLAKTDCRAATLVHPLSSLTRHVALGVGAVVTTKAVVTSDVRIGSHVHINVGATVSHDCVVDDFATLAPGTHLAGNVSVGEGCEIGIGVAVIPRVAIGAWSVIGAGAVVIRSLPANVTAVGVPARVVVTRQAGWHELAD